MTQGRTRTDAVFPSALDDVGRPSAPRTAPDAPCGVLRISILHVPDCPSVSRVRAALEVAMKSVGSSAVIEEIEGSYPSPTVLIDGAEIDGYPLAPDPACRIDLPEVEEIIAAIVSAGARRRATARKGEGSI